MFENRTFESLLENALNQVPSNLDKREGSILYNALAPACAELAQAYIDLDIVLQEVFADTASRDYLIRRANERGISLRPATAAIGVGQFNIDVPIGSRFMIDGLYYYQVTEKKENKKYQLQCEMTGSAPNGMIGQLLPVDYVEGLTEAELIEISIPGEDEEETEHFRKRYFNSLISQAYGGNIADYKEKVTAIAGIGGVKVYPVWNGGGTVKLVIINSNYAVPTPALVSKVQEIIDPPEKTGQGYGVAPIGHQVTVAPVTEKKIHLEFHLIYQSGYNFESVKTSIEQTVDAYFYDLNKTWADSENLVIRVARLESRILDLPGILDVTGTWINGDTKNMVLLPDEIAVRGDVIGTGN